MSVFFKKSNEHIAKKYIICQMLFSRIFSKVMKIEEKAEPIKFRAKLKTSICENKPDTSYLLPNTNPNKAGPKSRISSASMRTIAKSTYKIFITSFLMLKELFFFSVVCWKKTWEMEEEIKMSGMDKTSLDKSR